MRSPILTVLLLVILSSLHITHSSHSGDAPTESADGAASPLDTNTNDANAADTNPDDADHDILGGLQVTEPSNDNETDASDQSDRPILDEETNDRDKDDDFDTEYDPNVFEGEEVVGGGVWSSIGMIAVVICGCICLERLYSSCKKVYQKRTGRYGFSRLQNQTFNEFEDDEEIEMRLGTGRNTKDSDQESV